MWGIYKEELRFSDKEDLEWEVGEHEDNGWFLIRGSIRMETETLQFEDGSFDSFPVHCASMARAKEAPWVRAWWRVQLVWYRWKNRHQTAQGTVNDYLRRRAREDGYARKILPPIDVTPADLDARKVKGTTE